MPLLGNYLKILKNVIEEVKGVKYMAMKRDLILGGGHTVQ